MKSKRNGWRIGRGEPTPVDITKVKWTPKNIAAAALVFGGAAYFIYWARKKAGYSVTTVSLGPFSQTSVNCPPGKKPSMVGSQLLCVDAAG